jgi:molybdopterin synthase catalytic subunit
MSNNNNNTTITLTTTTTLLFLIMTLTIIRITTRNNKPIINNNNSNLNISLSQTHLTFQDIIQARTFCLQLLRGADDGPPSSSCGAFSLFEGITRADQLGDNKQVIELCYEAYDELALAELYRIAEQAQQQFHLHRIFIKHGLGSCPVGKTSLIVAATSPHRGNVFLGISFIIDELKKSVPIWKCEKFNDNTNRWKE